MPLLVVHWFSTSGGVIHPKQGILWFLVEIAAFSLESFLLAASDSPEICLSPFITLCIPPGVLTQQMVHMIIPSSFCLSLIPPIFLIILLELFPLDHSPHLAQAPLRLGATMRGHQDIYSVSLDGVSRQNQTVVST